MQLYRSTAFQPPLGLRGALSCVVTLLVGAAWIALLAAWVLFSDMVALVVRRAHALRASLGDRAAAAKSSFSTAIIVRVERRPRLSSMPKPVPQLAELLNACFLERKISFSAMLTGVASTVFLHPPVVALVKRLPEEPRLRCARALQAVFPQLVHACSAANGEEGVVSLDAVQLSSSSDASKASPTGSSASSEHDTVIAGSASDSRISLDHLDGAASEATPAATPRTSVTQATAPPPLRA